MKEVEPESFISVLETGDILLPVMYCGACTVLDSDHRHLLARFECRSPAPPSFDAVDGSPAGSP